MACVFQRHVRKGDLTARQAETLWRLFETDIEDGVWNLLPVSDALVRQVARIVRRQPAKLFLRAGDAVHLVSAQSHGFSEIWTSDRRLLEAAPYFGLRGRAL